MDTHLIFTYQPPPEAAEQDTTSLTEFRIEPASGLLVSAVGEVGTLSVAPRGGQEERHKEYRVVWCSHVFVEQEGKISTQYITVIVTEPEE